MAGRSRGAVVALALLASLSLPIAALASDGLHEVREATSAFRDVEAAQESGYGLLTGTPLEQCIDEPGEGAMGYHYVNGELVSDAEISSTAPEALLYVKRGGKLRLVGVEYVVFAEAWDAENDRPPSLFGREFHLVSAPNRYELPAFYELHAWAWQRNPSGTFNDWNPALSCPRMPDTATVAQTYPVDLPATTVLAVLAALALTGAAMHGWRTRLRARS